MSSFFRVFATHQQQQLSQRSCAILAAAVATSSSCGTALSTARRFAGDGSKATASEKKQNATPDIEKILEDDPVEVLRRIQLENAARAAALKDKAPPAPPRRSGKSMFFEAAAGTTNEEPEKSSTAPLEESKRAVVKPSAPRPMPKSPLPGQASGPLAGRKTTSTAAPGASAKGPTANPFMAKLNKMGADAKSPKFPTYDAAAEQRRRHIEEKIKNERKRLLVFRDVGMDLDKPILSRDVFLVLKYFRYGMEFAVDNELERQLRYFNEHAVNELKIIDDSKLMRGPPTLSRKQRHAPKRSVFSAPTPPQQQQKQHHAAGGVVGPSDSPTSAASPAASAFQTTSSFPQVQCAHLLQYCAPFSAESRAAVQTLLRPRASQSVFAQLLHKDCADSHEAGATAPLPKFDAKSESQRTLLSASSFRRPAVVIYSQMGQKFGSTCDEGWRRLAYTTICPALLPYLPVPATGNDTEQLTRLSSINGSSNNGSSNSHVSPPGAKGAAKSSPIDVISLRSTDLYQYRWVQSLYVRRLAKSLTAGAAGATEKDGAAGSVAGVKQYVTAASTFVGTRLLEPFYTTMGLRNYLLPQVMLVDHEGVVRWLSGGLPDACEAEYFPVLLRQLESEYYAAKRGV